MASEDLLVQALELLTVQPDELQVQSLSSDELRPATEARSWIAGPSVVGTGIGARRTQGVAQDELTIKVYLETKRPKWGIDDSHLIPGSVSIPTLGDSVPIDVEAIGVLRPQTLATKTRPLVPGYSIGTSIEEGVGTLGCFVALKDDPTTPLILSNAHVISNSGLASKGTKVIQPGELDGGLPADIVAELVSSVEFDFGPGFVNTCDAAVAKLLPGIDFTPALANIGTPGALPVEPKRGMVIKKIGRSTDFTTGTVTDVHFRTQMNYPKPGGGRGIIGFRDQVLCSRYSDSGDSGAVVCDENGGLVGLHWCGSTSVSVFSPMNFVLDKLNLQIWQP